MLLTKLIHALGALSLVQVVAAEDLSLYPRTNETETEPPSEPGYEVQKSSPHHDNDKCKHCPKEKVTEYVTIYKPASTITVTYVYGQRWSLLSLSNTKDLVKPRNQ